MNTHIAIIIFVTLFIVLYLIFIDMVIKRSEEEKKLFFDALFYTWPISLPLLVVFGIIQLLVTVVQDSIVFIRKRFNEKI